MSAWLEAFRLVRGLINAQPYLYRIPLWLISPAFIFIFHDITAAVEDSMSGIRNELGEKDGD